MAASGTAWAWQSWDRWGDQTGAQVSWQWSRDDCSWDGWNGVGGWSNWDDWSSWSGWNSCDGWNSFDKGWNNSEEGCYNSDDRCNGSDDVFDDGSDEPNDRVTRVKSAQELIAVFTQHDGQGLPIWLIVCSRHESVPQESGFHVVHADPSAWSPLPMDQIEAGQAAAELAVALSSCHCFQRLSVSAGTYDANTVPEQWLLVIVFEATTRHAFFKRIQLISADLDYWQRKPCLMSSLIASLESVREVDINSYLSDDGYAPISVVDALVRNGRLERCVFGGDTLWIGDVSAVLASNPLLSDVELVVADVDRIRRPEPEDFCDIFVALESCHFLRRLSLDFRKCDMDKYQHLDCLKVLIQSHPRLLHLSVVFEIGYTSLQALLPQSSVSLVSFSVFNLSFNEDDLKFVCDTLSSNTWLQKLELQAHCHLEGEQSDNGACVTLFKATCDAALGMNSMLTHLSINIVFSMPEREEPVEVQFDDNHQSIQCNRASETCRHAVAASSTMVSLRRRFGDIVCHRIFEFLFRMDIPSRWPHEESWCTAKVVQMPELGPEDSASCPNTRHAQQVAAPHDFDEEQAVKVRLAMASDETAQVERDNADLARALLASQAKMVKDELILLKFKHGAQAPSVEQALLSSTHLARCRLAVAAAQMSLRPEWAGGAWVLLPMPEEAIFRVLSDSPSLRLRPHHVLLRARDEKHLRAALTDVHGRRPRLGPDQDELWLENGSHRAQPCSPRNDLDEEDVELGASSASSGDSSSAPQSGNAARATSSRMASTTETEVPYVILRTFYDHVLPDDAQSEAAQSEPA